MIVDGRSSPETDLAYNHCEDIRDAFAGTGIIVHARVVGDAQEVVSRVKCFSKPGMKLIVGTHVGELEPQHRHYPEIHRIGS